MPKQSNKAYFDAQGRLLIKPYRLRDLAIIFDINRKTMRKWMDEYPADLKKHEGRYFSIRQVHFMVKKFGLPTHA